MIPRLLLLGKKRIKPFVHFSIVFRLYTALHNQRNISTNFLVFHNRAGISSKPAAFLIYFFSELRFLPPDVWFAVNNFWISVSSIRVPSVIFWPFDPAKNAIPRWCTGRRWHILMAVMRGNRVDGNWPMKWDELKNSHGTLIDWCTGREWPVNCMTVISAWWRLNIRFQRSSGRSSRRWTII